MNKIWRDIMKSSNREIQQKRIVNYFIDATDSIIKEEGIDAVTIRKVANKAGYNSATLYNYFKNLDELIAITLLNSTVEYIHDLKEVTSKVKVCYLRFLTTWYYYSLYAFKNPEVYTYIFYSKKSSSILVYLDTFFEFKYKNTTENNKKKYEKILGHSINERDNKLIDPCVKNGFIEPSKKDYINQFAYALNLGMCEQMKMNEYASPDVSAELFINYLLEFILCNSNIPEKKETLMCELKNIINN